jgi:hypothetical protein
MSVQVLMRCCVLGMNPGRRLPNGTEEVFIASGVTLSAAAAHMENMAVKPVCTPPIARPSQGLHTRGHFHRRLGQGLFGVTDGTRQLRKAAHRSSRQAVWDLPPAWPGSPLNPSPGASAPPVRPASLPIASVAQSGWLSATGMVVISGLTRLCKEPHHNRRGYIRASPPPDQG